MAHNISCLFHLLLSQMEVLLLAIEQHLIVVKMMLFIMMGRPHCSHVALSIGWSPLIRILVLLLLHPLEIESSLSWSVSLILLRRILCWLRRVSVALKLWLIIVWVIPLVLSGIFLGLVLLLHLLMLIMVIRSKLLGGCVIIISRLLLSMIGHLLLVHWTCP